MTADHSPTQEEVESELRDHSIILQQAAWNRSGTDQDYSISATLCEQAADTIASLRATLAERDAEIERMRADAASVAAEREACAKVAEGMAPATQDMLSTVTADWCEAIAAAIRSRPDEK